MKNNENEKTANSGKKPKYVKKIIIETILKYKLLSFGIVAAVCLAVIFSLIPPLILGKIIDMFTAGQMPGLGMVIAYFAMLFLTGLTESARGTSYGFWTENNTCYEKPSYGKIHISYRRRIKWIGAGFACITFYRRC